MVDHVIFSPRANLRYNPTENMNLRASYSFGFRAPQAFDEDLHIENVGGTVSMIELYGAQNETYIEGWEKKTSNLLIYKMLCKI